MAAMKLTLPGLLDGRQHEWQKNMLSTEHQNAL